MATKYETKSAIGLYIMRCTGSKTANINVKNLPV